MNRARFAQVLSWVLRVALGCLFAFSAVAKLLAIDHFELYVYSYGFFSLSFSFILARLCIGAELVLALLILMGWHPRGTRIAVLSLLILFSLFLCYALLVGRNESCQCFGQVLPLSPQASLLKNAILILLALFHFKLLGPHKPLRWRWIGVLAAAALVATPFVVSVPDSWYFGPSHEPYNAERLTAAVAPNGALAPLGVGSGRHVVAFVTPRCPYCRLAREKLDSMARRHAWPEGTLVYIEPSDISDSLFLQITYGARPLVLLMDGPSVLATYHLRNIDEREIEEFLGS